MKESIQMGHIKDSNFKDNNLDDLYEFYDLYQGFVPIFNNCDCKNEKERERKREEKKKKKKKKE